MYMEPRALSTIWEALVRGWRGIFARRIVRSWWCSVVIVGRYIVSLGRGRANRQCCWTPDVYVIMWWSGGDDDVAALPCLAAACWPALCWLLLVLLVKVQTYRSSHKMDGLVIVYGGLAVAGWLRQKNALCADVALCSYNPDAGFIHHGMWQIFVRRARCAGCLRRS